MGQPDGRCGWGVAGGNAHAVAHGRPVPGDGVGPVVLLHDGEAVAVARADGAGLLRPSVVLAVQEAG